MKCPKCNYELKNNLSICPRCGSPLVERKVTKTVKALKGSKSKIDVQDQSNLVGGTVGKGNIISLKKSPRHNNQKKELSLKDYNSVVDYKEAKEKLNEENVNPFEGITSFTDKKKKPINIYSNQDLFNNIDKNTGIENNKVNNVVSNSTSSNGYFFNNLNNSKRNEEVRKAKNTVSLFGITKDNQFVDNGNKKSKKSKNGKRNFNIFAYVVVITLWIITLWSLFSSTRENYYFSEDESNNEIIANNDSPELDEEMSQYKGVSKSGQKGGSSGEGLTSIVYDNQYIGQLTLKSEEDVYKLISADSLKQKDNCPSNVVNIENDIINNYGITAVNLCEIDYDFALEIRNVVKYIYNNYPSARSYLTNLTIANVGDNNFIAAFMPIFSFATSKTNSGYPIGIKTQILLNAKYYLNTSKIKSSVNYGEKSGYFPANASRSSTVAHEFGHYLSYVALLNYYNADHLTFVKSSQVSTLYKVYDDFNAGTFSYNLLREAYDDYSKIYSNDSFEEFRSSISGYAVAKDTSGNYIYDETIAEAFHDVYLNGDLAKPASSFVVKVLVSKL